MTIQELHRGRLIDHVQLVVKDLASSRRFYAAVLEVLRIPVEGEAEGYFWADELVISSGQSEAAQGTLTGRVHLASQRRTARLSRHFTRRGSPLAAATMVSLTSVPITPATTQPFCWIPTVITSRRCTTGMVTCRADTSAASHSTPRGQEDTNMSELRYPNESNSYREARAALLKDEQELIQKVKSVAEKRRQLPLGGRLKEDYIFQWANDGKVGKAVRFSELFGDKNSLLLYSWMFGPNWDKPCPSCTSLMDGFDRTWYSVAQNAAFAAVAKAPAERINVWAKERGWSQIPLLSGSQSSYQADYKCQGETEDMQLPVMHVFTKRDGKIFHFWGTESMMNHVDTVWPYWNLMDFTPEGRPNRDTPPQKFRSEFLEKNYLNK
jgi:predicted dithiol-disulfide oxidoreductase (DUF899 family)